MIRKKEEIRVREVKNAQKGEGSVFFSDWLLPEEAPNHGRVFSKVTIPVGASIGAHAHVGEFEAFYVLSGEACVTDNGNEVLISAGDMHLCKNGEQHGVRNTSASAPLELLALIMKDLS